MEHTGGSEVKKSPFLLHQKGDITLWREGSKSFCHMSHVHFCVSVSTQFGVFLEALQHENLIFHDLTEKIKVKVIECLSTQL